MFDLIITQLSQVMRPSLDTKPSYVSY